MGRRTRIPDEPLSPVIVKLHIFRALSGMKQAPFAEAIGVDPPTLAKYESGLHVPEAYKLVRGAQAAGVSLELGDEILRLAEVDRLKRLRPGGRADDLLSEAGDLVRSRTGQAWRRLLALPLPPRVPHAEDRLRAREQLTLFQGYTPAQRAAVLDVDDEHQPWALALEAGEAAVSAASRDPEEAAALAQLAREMAEQVEGPEGWPIAILSFAMAYEASTRWILGELKAARALFKEAKGLAKAGSDPYKVLDPGRLPELEAALCQAEGSSRL